MIGRIIALCVVLDACASSSDRQTVELDALHFDVPDGWRRTDTNLRDSSFAIWTPVDNERKESVVVIRSHRSATAKADVATLERLIMSAQGGLPHAQVGKVAVFTTDRGLAGVRVELDFVPRGLRSSYHRAHAVLVHGEDVVTVLYTARDPEVSLAAFNLVLGSIRHEEG